MENALLRERINDVAAEVARLTATSKDRVADRGHYREASFPPRDHGGEWRINVDWPQLGDSKGTLADRIRALQSRACITQARDA